MKHKTTDLHTLIDVENTEAVRDEVKLLFNFSFPGISIPCFDCCLDDTVRIFRGEYDGYQSCNTEYHDLRHTMEVLIATARMIHATILDGKTISPPTAELALISSLMHDIGYIQDEEDNGTGGQYTLVHVERSADFFKGYGKKLGLSDNDIEKCCCMITATSLAIDPNTIRYPDQETELAAKLVASADLLGQLADRLYLEKLLFLYQEFRAAGVLAYANEIDLLTQTCSFYRTVRRRLDEKLGSLDKPLRLHFRERWKIDSDLYSDSIVLNLQYLDFIVGEHRHDYRDKLKRGGIVERIIQAESDEQYAWRQRSRCNG